MATSGKPVGDNMGRQPAESVRLPSVTTVGEITAETTSE